MSRKPWLANATVERRSRLSTLWFVVIGITLGTIMLSCSSDSNPMAPPGPGPEGPAGWFWQNPLPVGILLRAVSFTDANTGTAVGDAGTILRTTETIYQIYEIYKTLNKNFNSFFILKAYS